MCRVEPGRSGPRGLLPPVRGIAGGVIGGWAAGNFGLSRILTWVVAIGAAIVLLFLFEAMRKKR